MMFTKMKKTFLDSLSILRVILNDLMYEIMLCNRVFIPKKKLKFEVILI